MSDQPSVTPSEIASRVLELDEKASPGPWKRDLRQDGRQNQQLRWGEEVIPEESDRPIATLFANIWKRQRGVSAIPDAELISEYRTAAPKLARAYQQLEQENAKLREQLAIHAKDWADDDTAIKELAKPFGVRDDNTPGYFKNAVQVVEELTQKFKAVRELADGLRKELAELDEIRRVQQESDDAMHDLHDGIENTRP
jgi:Xaa-Pro aminopeptidase